MPTLVRLGNIKIQMFADDHNPPHFHVVTPDHEALVSLASHVVLRGAIRASDLRTALAWANENAELLAREWSRLND